MQNDPFIYVAAFACLVVLAILVIGVLGFAQGGKFNSRNANRLMRWRIGAQAVALLVIIAYVWSRGG
ncbi:twin transmembrane helix small protein [Paracoccus cavernae]|uniref:twin transmembrane helix small protein n=1 Tax=Paracoccus cavernae TaxID=1571207 RepID=UPI0035F26B5C